MSPQDEVIVAIEIGILRIRLNRPQTIHALNINMVQIITRALLGAYNENKIRAVLIDHFDGRGFCSGGDIAMLRESGSKDGKQARAFFYAEYQLNHLIKTYPKPIISFLDGITMGGGVGLSVHGKYRIITPNTIFAMPETGIGLFPDVGGGWFLPRLNSQIGIWLALSGARFRAGDCLAANIGTHYIDSKFIAPAKNAIINNEDTLENLLAKYQSQSIVGGAPGPIELNEHNLELIATHFRFDTIQEIFSSLASSGDEWAKKQLAILQTKSAQTLVVALKQMRLGAMAIDFAQNMQMEYRIGARVISLNDFQEGVRALIIDKDNSPKWLPKTIYEIDNDAIDAIFAPLPLSEEWKPLQPNIKGT